MKFEEIIKQLKAGMKVRRKSWDKGIYFVQDTPMSQIKTHGNKTAPFCREYFEADDWEIYEEEKENKKIQIEIEELRKLDS